MKLPASVPVPFFVKAKSTYVKDPLFSKGCFDAKQSFEFIAAQTVLLANGLFSTKNKFKCFIGTISPSKNQSL